MAATTESPLTDKIPVDKIVITDLEVWGQIGWTEEERSKPQRLLVSVELSVNLSKAAKTRCLEDTVCYATLAQRYCSTVQSKSWVLLEELAEELCTVTLENALAKHVLLTIKKFAVPGAAWAGVSLMRSKAAV